MAYGSGDQHSKHRSVRRHHHRRRAMICTHRIKPGCRISRFWSLAPVRDLLFRAKHLLFEANHTSDRARTGRAWGQAQKFELLISRGAAPGTLVPVLSCLWEFGTDRPALHRRKTSGASPTRRDGRMGVECTGPRSIAGTGLTGLIFASGVLPV